MLKHGIFSKSFEDSIYSYSLGFIDPKLEQAYAQARTQFRLITRNSKCFLWTIVAGYFMFAILDVVAASSGSSEYGYSTATWIAHGLMIPIGIFEIACYSCRSMNGWRGIVASVLGTIILFFNAFESFYSSMYYPFMGIG